MASIMSAEHAAKLDDTDSVPCMRDLFWVPSTQQLDDEKIGGQKDTHAPESTYLCGNSLGLQPKATEFYVNAQLQLWQSKGVYGHFKKTDSLIPPWLNTDETVQKPMARLVGANVSEVSVMQTLSANLHLLMSCFYKPTSKKYKIMLEAKSFPSDHFVVESQLRHHGVDVKDGMILLQPLSDKSPCLPTEHILQRIDEHADSLALVLLPGIQFYTGQFFDMKRITAHAQSKDIVMGWDLAHAVGNVPLSLHDWNVDFAAWCNYKYMNAGPGAIGGLFVHSRHTDIVAAATNGGDSTMASGEMEKSEHRPRLQGWWGSTKASRFTMDNRFEAMPGAAGFQLSNPSVLDITALMASLSVFEKTSMSQLREKSLRLTGYLEELLLSPFDNGTEPPYKIITPSDPAQRGVQLSIRLDPALLEKVVKVLEEEHVVVDERKPDVIRVAPAPLYNNFNDCYRFTYVFRKACAAHM